MPRWKALPDELDPQIKEFTSQLRRLVDRSGLSVAALADRTGYSRTSWERYLGGRLLAPKGAVVALAEVTGTNPVHLTTMWELAERAWSRAEMRHDMTIEAIRVSQARAALGEFGGPPVPGTATRNGSGTTAAPGAPGLGGGSPAIPQQPTGAEAEARRGGAEPVVNSWNLAGYEGPSRVSARPAARPQVPAPTADGGFGPAPGTPSPYGERPRPRRPAPPARRRRLTMFLAGAAGVLVLVGAVLLFTRGAGGGGEDAVESPSPSASTRALPAGVKCVDAGCTGKDAEAMGCSSGDLATTAKTAVLGTATLEVRYSKTCGAAWGRVTGAVPGDEVRVSAGKTEQKGRLTDAGDTIAYTPMVAVKDAAEARACAVLVSGGTGCTS
ncbi:DUF2690 domain-containing protein [Streptomyces sp. NPDC026672]|uniref:helix-turn-helix domain-containing protein n=1 Tax=unclassified Streptomyces TaxID=2593676 RepID=UPI0033C2BAFC